MIDIILFFSLIPLILTLILMLKKDLWNKIIGLSSITIKVFIIMTLFSLRSSQNYFINLSIYYLMLSGTGVSLMIFFIIGSDME